MTELICCKNKKNRRTIEKRANAISVGNLMVWNGWTTDETRGISRPSHFCRWRSVWMWKSMEYYYYFDGDPNRRERKRIIKTIYRFLCCRRDSAYASRTHNIHLSNLFIDTFRTRSKYRCLCGCELCLMARHGYNGRGNASSLVVPRRGRNGSHEFNLSSVCGKWTKTKPTKQQHSNNGQ